MRSIFLALVFAAGVFAQDTGKSLTPLSDQDAKGSDCGKYFRLEGGKVIYHVKGEEKTSSEPVDYIAKIVEDDKADVPSVIEKPIAVGNLLTIVMSTTERKAAKCLPVTIYVEKRQ